MGMPVVKLMNEVPTRWKSTYHMLARISEQREPVWVSLRSLKTDLTPLSADNYRIIHETLIVLAPFNEATVELSEEKRVFGSKLIPTLKMLHYNASNVRTDPVIQLLENLKRRVTDTLCGLESVSLMSIATLLDPRFKTLGFLSSSKANEAVNRLKAQCAAEVRMPEPTPSALIGSTSEEAQPGPSTQHFSSPPCSGM